MTEKISIITDEISQGLAECEEFLAGHDLHAELARKIRESRGAWYMAPWSES